jgi:hypothetical protein
MNFGCECPSEQAAGAEKENADMHVRTGEVSAV